MSKARSIILIFVFLAISIFAVFQIRKAQQIESIAEELSDNVHTLSEQSDSLSLVIAQLESQNAELLKKLDAPVPLATATEPAAPAPSQKVFQLIRPKSQFAADEQPQETKKLIASQQTMIQHQTQTIERQQSTMYKSLSRSRANSYSAVAYRYLESDPNLAFRLAEYALKQDPSNALSKNLIVESFYQGPWDYDNTGEFALDGQVYVGVPHESDNYQIIDLTTQKAMASLDKPSKNDEIMAKPLVFSQDGEHFLIRQPETDAKGLYVVNVYNREGEVLFTDHFDTWPHSEFSENGRYLMVRSKMYDLDNNTSIPLNQRIEKFPQLTAVAWTPNNSLMALTNRKLYMYDVLENEDEVSLFARNEMKIEGKFFVSSADPFDFDASAERIKFSPSNMHIAVLNGPSVKDQYSYFVDIFFMDKFIKTSIGDTYRFDPAIHFSADGKFLLVYDEDKIGEAKSRLVAYPLEEVVQHAELISPKYKLTREQTEAYKAEILNILQDEKPQPSLTNEKEILYLVNEMGIFGESKTYSTEFLNRLLKGETKSTAAIF